MADDVYLRSNWSPDGPEMRPPSLKYIKQMDGSLYNPDTGYVIPPNFVPSDESLIRNERVLYDCGGLYAPWGIHPDCFDDTITNSRLTGSPLPPVPRPVESDIEAYRNDPGYGGSGRRPVFCYPPGAAISALAGYGHSPLRFWGLEFAKKFLFSGDYDHFMIGVPANNNQRTIPWRGTFRAQLSAPPGSYLLMIQGSAKSTGLVDAEEVTVEAPFRLQLFDDGAGMYIYDSMIKNTVGCGGQGITNPNDPSAFGPFVLPGPWVITYPGLVTVAMTNVQTSTTEGSFQDIVADLCLIFATPKQNCCAVGGSGGDPLI